MTSDDIRETMSSEGFPARLRRRPLVMKSTTVVEDAMKPKAHWKRRCWTSRLHCTGCGALAMQCRTPDCRVLVCRFCDTTCAKGHEVTSQRCVRWEKLPTEKNE